MPFQLERDMYDTALKHLPGLLPVEAPYAYCLEVPLSRKVADIGFISTVCQGTEASEARSLAQLTLTEVWALAQIIECGETGISEFWSFLGSSATICEKQRTTNRLCKAGVLHEDRNGLLAPGRWLTDQLGPVILVELKLSRWEEALAQACFYRQMADMACVVLDGEYIDAVPEEPFVEEGIGLFAAWSENIDMLVAPRVNDHAGATYRTFNRLRAVQDLSRTRPRKWTVA